MKRLLAPFLVLAFAFSSPTLFAEDASSTDPERLAAADKLLRLFKVDENMGAAFDQVEKIQVSMLEQQQLDEEAKARAVAAMEESMSATREEFTWDKIGSMFVEIYAEVFTKEELDDLIKFYESPIGIKFIQKQPQLQAATMKRMQGMMTELMPKITEKVKAAAEAPAAAE